MGSKSSHFKYGPGLLLDKAGCIIDTVGFCPEGYVNPSQAVDNTALNFQHNLKHQIQHQVNANGEPPTYNIINLIEKPPTFENDLFMPFIKPFSTYCPQPFETPIYPPFAMPRPLPCPQQEFLMPFSNFCKQTYPHVQQDPNILPQITYPITQLLFPNQLITPPGAQTMAPPFNPVSQFNQAAQLNAASQFNSQFNQATQFSNQTSQFNPASQFSNPNSQFNPASQFSNQTSQFNQASQFANATSQFNNALPNSSLNNIQIQPQPVFQFYPVPVPQPVPASNQFSPASAAMQAPALTQKFPQAGFFNQLQQPTAQQQQQQQQLTALMLQQSPFNLQPTNNQKLLQTQPQAQQPQQPQLVGNSNFLQQAAQLFAPQNNTFGQQNFLQAQNPYFQPQLTNPLNNFQFNSLPTQSLLEHLSQIMVQPAGQQPPPQLQPLQKVLNEQLTTNINLGSANYTNSFKPIPITHQQQSIQYLIPPSSSADPRNTQPFDQQGVPNIASGLNLVRDSLGPRPLQSFDANSFANPFMSLHSLVGSQQPMNEPFAQSIEFLMNSS